MNRVWQSGAGRRNSVITSESGHIWRTSGCADNRGGQRGRDTRAAVRGAERHQGVCAGVPAEALDAVTSDQTAQAVPDDIHLAVAGAGADLLDLADARRETPGRGRWPERPGWPCCAGCVRGPWRPTSRDVAYGRRLEAPLLPYALMGSRSLRSVSAVVMGPGQGDFGRAVAGCPAPHGDRRCDRMMRDRPPHRGAMRLAVALRCDGPRCGSPDVAGPKRMRRPRGGRAACADADADPYAGAGAAFSERVPRVISPSLRAAKLPGRGCWR